MDDAFIALLCPGGSRTVVRFMHIGGQEISTWECGEEVYHWRRINRPCAPAIALALRGAVVLIEAPIARQIARVDFPATVRAISYDVSENLLYVADGECQVAVAPVEC
jgi:hypothetical protein